VVGLKIFSNFIGSIQGEYQ